MDIPVTFEIILTDEDGSEWTRPGLTWSFITSPQAGAPAIPVPISSSFASKEPEQFISEYTAHTDITRMLVVVNHKVMIKTGCAR